jgi:ABC-2 type transport system ATP-binding protein
MANAHPPIIRMENLSKQYKILNRREGFINGLKDLFSRDYKIVEAVKDFTLDVAEGEIIGFIGPNGAGKSTAIKMMTGVLEPTSGSITVNGRVPYKNRRENAKSIGVVFGQRSQLWWDLPVIESFKILKEIFRIPNDEFKSNLDAYNSVVDISPLYGQPVRMLSLGQRMVCDIFAAFLHSPKIVFLDEPTIGLDVSVKANVREIIRSLNREKNTTVILTSHDLADIESLSKRIIIIDKGAIIYDGSYSGIATHFSGYRTLRLDIAHKKEEFVADVRTRFNAEAQTTQEGMLEISIHPDTVDIMALITYAVSAYTVRDLAIQSVRAEEIIRKIYEGGTL